LCVSFRRQEYQIIPLPSLSGKKPLLLLALLGRAFKNTQPGRSEIKRFQFPSGTNNEAEYRALIAALEDLMGRIERANRVVGQYTLEIRGDSARVLNQVPTAAGRTASPPTSPPDNCGFCLLSLMATNCLP
jgi:hypothetical protein